MNHKNEIEKKKELLNFFYNIELITINLNNKADRIIKIINKCKKENRIKKIKKEYNKIIFKLKIIEKLLNFSEKKLLKLKLLKIIKKLTK